MKPLIFVETREELSVLEPYLEKKGIDVGEINVVALSLKSQIVLKKK